jgi:hypothetical protein
MTASMQSVGPPAHRPSIGLRTPWPPRLSTCM